MNNSIEKFVYWFNHITKEEKEAVKKYISEQENNSQEISEKTYWEKQNIKRGIYVGPAPDKVQLICPHCGEYL